LDLLREAHREPIAEAHYAAVRARVLAGIAAERRPWRPWIWACGFAGLAVLAVLVGRTPWSAQGPVAPLSARPISLSALTERPAGGPATDQGVRPTSVGRRKRRPQRTTAAPAPYRVIGPPAAQPLLVKLVTDDPNIVIYWISGE
jgi:hypothetical protein